MSNRPANPRHDQCVSSRRKMSEELGHLLLLLPSLDEKEEQIQCLRHIERTLQRYITLTKSSGRH